MEENNPTTLPESVIQGLTELDWNAFDKVKYIAIIQTLEQEGFLPERDLLASMDFLRLPPVRVGVDEYRLYFSPYYQKFQAKPTRPKSGLNDILESPNLALLLTEWRAFSLGLPFNFQTKKQTKFIQIF